MSKWIVINICVAALLQVGLVVSQSPTQAAPITDPPVPRTCGLDGYDVPLLYEAPYWNINVTSKSECIVPLNKTVSDVSSCRILLAVCRPLNETHCPGNYGSATCMEVTLTDYTKKYYDIGSHQGKEKFSPIDERDKDGFLTLRGGSRLNTTQCTSTASTILVFECDETIEWNPNGTRDVTDFVIFVEKLPFDPCVYIITLKYSGACYISPTLAPGRCHLDNYDIKTLATQEFWFADVPTEVCIGEGYISCQFLLAFCHDIPPSVGVGCYGSSVCQIGELAGQETVEYSMGRFVPNETHFVENVDVVGGGFHMDVQNGSKPHTAYDNCTQYGIRTRVVLVCNSSADWSATQDISQFLHIAYDEHLDPCMFTLALDYKGACTPQLPVPVASSSVSNILGGVFFGVSEIVLIVYFTIGCAYQYFVKKERGIRIIPNYHFWKNFVVLVYEGCKFFLEIITCFQCTCCGKKTTEVEYDRVQQDCEG